MIGILISGKYVEEVERSMGIKPKTYFFIFSILFFEISTPLARGKTPFGICSTMISRVSITIGSRLEKVHLVKKGRPTVFGLQALGLLFFAINAAAWQGYKYLHYEEFQSKELALFNGKIHNFLSNINLKSDREIEKKFIDLVKNGINSEYPRVRERALEKIDYNLVSEIKNSKIKNIIEKLIPLVKKRLNDRDSLVRFEAIGAFFTLLLKTNAKTISDNLHFFIENFDDPDEKVQRFAINASRDLLLEKDAKIIRHTLPFFIKKIDDPDVNTRRFAIDASRYLLLKTDAKTISGNLPFIIKRLDDPYWGIRKSALYASRALLFKTDAKTIKDNLHFFLEKLKDDHEAVRYHALYTSRDLLLKFDAKTISGNLHFFIEKFDDRDPFVRLHALYASRALLLKTDAKTIRDNVPFFIKKIKDDDDEDVRRYAIGSLIDLLPLTHDRDLIHKTIEHMKQRLEIETNQGVKSDLNDAIKKLTPLLKETNK